MPRLGKDFRESFALVTETDEVLREDTMLALRQLHAAVAAFNAHQATDNGEEAEYCAKVAIRALLGHVDGLSYTLRQVVVRSARQAGLTIPARKLAELMERKFDSNADAILEEEKLISTEASLKAGAAWFPRLFGAEFRLDTDGEGFRGFKRLVTVRNAFTHPEELEHLYPTPALPAIQPTIVWFLAQMRDMFGACASKLGFPVPPPEKVALEYPYREKDHPLVPIFSPDDVREIRRVAGRTYEYVKMMVVKSSRDVSRALDSVLHANSPLPSHAYQYAVRNAVRTLFSEVEARTGATVFFLEAAEERGEITLSEAAKASLSGGAVEDNFVNALTIFSREYGCDRHLATSGKSWQLFQGARLFRDRLTHPKGPPSLNVDPQAAIGFLEAVKYFHGSTDALKLDVEKCIAKRRVAE
jgi:hypothetical protein